METKNENYGLIYVLSNECMPNLLKIGMTTRTDLKKRMDELFSTGVPVNFKEVASCRVPLEKLKEVEAALHSAFQSHRKGTHEFFEITPAEVIPILKILEKAYGLTDSKKEVQKVIDGVTEEDNIKHGKRPNMDFFEMGLSVGAVLIYNNDEAVRCSVTDRKKVEYEGKTYSLSNLTHQLLGTKHAVRPAPLWHTEDGRSLIQLYNETLAAQLAATDAAIAAANAEYDQFKTECK